MFLVGFIGRKLEAFIAGNIFILLMFLTTVDLTDTPNTTTAVPQGMEVCYDEMGCFLTGGEFFNVLFNQLLTVPPENPKVIGTTFLLYTRKNRNDSRTISTNNTCDEIKSFNFDAQKPVKIIVHGFLSNGRATWIQNMTLALLSAEDVNVIAVDWSKGARFPLHSIANTRVVGAEIALLLLFLQNNCSLEMKQVHLIGHSLGAQVCGFAGKRILDPKIFRITGLDAADIYFGTMPPTARLYKTDATFVDAIHTDGNKLGTGIGIYYPYGSIDFYPDGGEIVESCEAEAIFSDGLLMFSDDFAVLNPACSHTQSHQFYTSSINSVCPFMAHACENFQNYEKGFCTSCGENSENCQTMGYHAIPDPATFGKSFYLTTNEDPVQICLYHWVIRITMATKSKSAVSGTIDVSIKGNELQTNKIKVTPAAGFRFQPGKTYTFLIAYPDDPGHVESLEFYWVPSLLDRLLNLFGMKKLFVNKLVLEPLDIRNESERTKSIVQFCSPALLQGVTRKSVFTLNPSSDC